MSDNKIVVPDEMLKAVSNPLLGRNMMAIDLIKASLELAVGWLAENPILPTPEQAAELTDAYGHRPHLFGEWQRRMFLESEPEITERK